MSRMETAESRPQGYVQAAYIVADVEQAARKWAGLGAGPFFLKPYKTQGEPTYLGQPANLDHISAFGQYGALMIELIQPLGEGPTVYSLPGGGEGLHHFAQICPDLEASIASAAALGRPLVCRSGTVQTPAAFVDARADLGHLIELCQESPQLRYLYDFVAKAAQAWDGADPVRRLGGPAK
jgi:hypothetical protein